MRQDLRVSGKGDALDERGGEGAGRLVLPGDAPATAGGRERLRQAAGRPGFTSTGRAGRPGHWSRYQYPYSRGRVLEVRPRTRVWLNGSWKWAEVGVQLNEHWMDVKMALVTNSLT